MLRFSGLFFQLVLAITFLVIPVSRIFGAPTLQQVLSLGVPSWLIWVANAVLPTMRQQRSGKIITMSSVGGLVGFPFRALYVASKFALEGYTESLRYEVRPFGISVSLVEPGRKGEDVFMIYCI